MRVFLLVALVGCGIDVGTPTEWIPAVDGPLAPELGPQPMPAAPSSVSTLRLVTYNVHLGADPAEMASEILGNPALANAGVYLLQEEESWPGEGSSRASRLAALLGTGWIYIPGRMKGEGTHGLAILSRFPIEGAEVMTLPTTDNWKPRIAIRAEVVIGELRLPIVDVHLETRINITDRILQIRPAIIDLPDTAVVAGDVNTNPYLWEDGEVPLIPTAQIVDTDQAPILDDYVKSLDFETPAAKIGPTQHMYGIESRLDAIYTRGIEHSVAHVERTLASSDHWPVWIDLTLP
jgi:endonuclease/exonuclease/phosphatase family metal-dependent hydrolase